jgi:c-di-GMP-binding flagellar brake protein YcgR
MGIDAMTKSTHELLGEATPEELLACIQLLAVSVVQHRAKCGFVTLSKTTEQLRSTEDQAVTTGLFVQSKEVLEEALEMVRVLAAESAWKTDIDAEPSATSADNRTQYRIRISIPIKVLWPQDPKPLNAKLVDISWGGASICVEQARIDTGDTIQIILPRRQGGSISVEAKVLRVKQNPDGNSYEIATRFSKLGTRDEAKLEEILEYLSQSADDGGQRNHARLTQRLDIQFDSDQELLSTLDDISTGGLGITVPDPVQIGQSLQIVISALDESCFLKLRARVVRQDPIKYRSMVAYRVGLKFEHPSEELEKRTAELIGKMAAMRRK